MPDLYATLADAPVFDWDGEEIQVDSRKQLAMLCYLSLRGSSSREELAELLWSSGRLLNVRQALYQLRQLPGAGHWLGVGDTVTVRVDSDVRRFEQAVASQEHSRALQESSPRP